MPFPEMCDDGARNGTVESLCNKYCVDTDIERGRTYSHTYIGFTPKAAAAVKFGWGRGGFAFTAFDDRGLVIAPDIREHDFRPLADATPVVSMTTVSLPTRSTPVAIGTVLLNETVGVPIWVERPLGGDTAPRMYYASVDAALQSTVHELPYPFPDGTQPTLHTSYHDRHGVLLVDQSRTPPYDLLVAMIVVRSPTDVTTSTLRVPAPGRVRGAAVETTTIEDPSVVYIQRLVQFFEDTGTFVAIVDRPPPGVPAAEARTYEVKELARGSWPSRVVSGTQWPEGCDEHGREAAGYTPSRYPEFSSPVPLALLTDTGDIYTWRFVEGLEGEQFVTPFGHVAAGSRVLRTYDVFLSALSWEPDGTFVWLADSDCRDLKSTAMKAQRYAGVGPWATMNAVITSFAIHGRGDFLIDDWLVSLP